MALLEYDHALAELSEFIKEIIFMHTLHRILVNIEKLETSDKDTIRDFVYIETHDFYNTVFD